MKSPKEFLSNGMRLEDFFEFLVTFIILHFSHSLFFELNSWDIMIEVRIFD